MEFRILGPVAAFSDGHELSLGGPKQRAVLAALLLQTGRVVSRERLVAAVWGDDPPASAVRALQVYVHGLRRVLGADRIETHGQGYLFRAALADVDQGRFDQLVDRGRRELSSGEPAPAAASFKEALSLWRGPALADIAGEPVARTETGRLEDSRLDALELWADAELALGRHELVIQDLETLIWEHPYRERPRELHALALYRSGRQKDALDALRTARETLVVELGVEPGPGIRELERRILQHDPALVAVTAPEQHTTPSTRLPAPPNPLVGRQLEIAAVGALFRTGDVRLVTLTGPGGTGKTRLALAVAEELALELEDGAVFVDLAPIRDPTLVVAAVAEALGVHENGDSLATALARRAATLRSVVVLDNFEHLLPAAQTVADLLAAGPGLLLLVTSRSLLRLSGEHGYVVPPLALPQATGVSFEALIQNDSVRLFVARARAASGVFALDEESAILVARICRRVDGLPLAIELAAARARLLSLADVADRLERSFELLAGGARDLPARQQTLRATLDWSYGLLQPAEQRLLARLSVFAGGFTLESAGVVGAEGGEDVLELLGSLVDQSLLRRVERPSGERRFALLETIREYASERLRETGETERVQRAHAEHFAGRAEGSGIHAGATEEILATLDADHDDLRAALESAARTGEIETEVRLAVALRPYWLIRGELTEATRFFDGAIERSRRAGPELLARALVSGAAFPYRQGDLVRARELWEEALRLHQELGDDEEAARTLAELGGIAFSEGDFDRADELYAEAVAGFRRSGNRVRLALALANRGATETSRGNLQASIRYAEEAVEIQREIGDRDSMAVTLYNLGRVHLEEGEGDPARAHVSESLALAQSLGYREVIAHCLEAVAELAHAAGSHAESARFLGASEALFAVLGIPMQGEEAAGLERTTAAIAGELGGARVDELVREGATAAVEDMITDAQRLLRTGLPV